MFVLGTAGHVDHGKSSLVIALTGIDPDRLPEEKERGMTIVLGFAWLDTQSGQRVGIVDVPGHERFVKNMIAGVGAIDFVLFVVAADDGWMPQTAEHLAILQYLGVRTGIVVITKKELAAPDWLELVREDVRAHLSGSFLADAPLIAVDSISGAGIPELKAAIDAVVQGLPPRPDYGRPRLYIDRAFAMAGRGSVVTGTLIDGALTVGQSALIVPDAIRCRIRELQNHGVKVERIAPGQRVAANLAGVEIGQLRRGQCLISGDNAETFDRIWADVHILPDTPQPLKSERRVRVMVGTAEPDGAAFPLDPNGIPPGGSGLCEFVLDEPLKACWLDRFVLRWPSPTITIGGGTILDLGGTREWRRSPALRKRLETRRTGNLPAFRTSELQKTGYAAREGFLRHGPFPDSAIETDLRMAIDSGEATMSGPWICDAAWLRSARDTLLTTLAQRHTTSPFEIGLNLAEWHARADVPGEPILELARLLEQEGSVKRSGDAYHLPDHSPSIPAEWSEEESNLRRMLEAGGWQPPPRPELESASEHARQIIVYWLATGRIVTMGDGVIFSTERFTEIKRRVIEHLKETGSLTAAQLRDLLGTSRRYAVPIIEALDRAGVTRRTGDTRVLADAAPHT